MPKVSAKPGFKLGISTRIASLVRGVSRTLRDLKISACSQLPTYAQVNSSLYAPISTTKIRHFTVLLPRFYPLSTPLTITTINKFKLIIKGG